MPICWPLLQQLFLLRLCACARVLAKRIAGSKTSKPHSAACVAGAGKGKEEGIIRRAGNARGEEEGGWGARIQFPHSLPLFSACHFGYILLWIDKLNVSRESEATELSVSCCPQCYHIVLWSCRLDGKFRPASALAATPSMTAKETYTLRCWLHIYLLFLSRDV